jgi:hypothetical protein
MEGYDSAGQSVGRKRPQQRGAHNQGSRGNSFQSEFSSGLVPPAESHRSPVLVVPPASRRREMPPRSRHPISSANSSCQERGRTRRGLGRWPHVHDDPAGEKI